jgi:hypothetical protein
MGVLDDAIREHLELKRKHGAPEEELRRQEEEALGPVRREVAPPDEVEVKVDGEPAAEAPGPAAEPVAEPFEPAEPVAEQGPAAEPVAEPFEPAEPVAEQGPAAEPVAEPSEPAEPVAEQGPAAEPVAEPAPFDAETSLLVEPEPEPFPEDEAAAVSQAAEPAEPEPHPFPEEEAAAVPKAAEPAEPPAEPEPFPEEQAVAVPQAAEPVGPLPEPEESGEDEEAIFDAPDDGALGRDARTVPTVDEDGDGADLEDESGRSRDVLEDTPDFLEETPEHNRLWFEQRPPRDFDFD